VTSFPGRNALDRTALADLLRRENLRRLLAVLNGDGEETRIVGGAVRNALLGRPVAEVDCATTAAPEEVTGRAGAAGFKTVPTGIEHGTVTVIVAGVPFEVTTLREDVETDGRHAVVRFGRDFATDAHRRDFTINALSLGLDGHLHDYTDGVADLLARRVRFIGDARTRIREDYLRILRFFRFHAEYGDSDLDPAGLAAALAERAGLAGLSHERVRSELLKLLVARRAVEVVGALAELGLLTRLLGGVAELGRFARVAAFEAGAGASDPPRRLAALAITTEEDVERLRERLRLSNSEQMRLSRYAALLVVLKTWPLALDPVGIRRLVAEHGLDEMVDALAALAGEPKPVLDEAALEALRRFRSGEEPVPVFPLRGADLVARGVPAGPRIGELLGLARRAWLAEGCPTDAAAVQALLRRTLDGAACH
jgi:poly(A) polymerase